MAADTVAQVKAKLTILDVVGQVVKLKKAGRSYTGLCPFHKEKTPSFHVSLERNSYHCFGCGEGGDIFTFVEKTEGVDFKGALKILAERAGVELVYESSAEGKEQRSKQERMREAMARATQFYQSQLGQESSAYSYAHSRGLHADTIKDWGLGYAPDAWRSLLEHLTAQGFSLPELMAAGLIKEAQTPGTYYDRFRNRLMFPIQDGAGRVVAFTGRALAADEQAKYLNSPETELYHKSEILYGLDKAKEAIRQRGFALLVEGQMDVLHAHQAGFANAIALSGTAFTERHAALLKRYAENLMLVLDGDAAGLSATAKAALIALRAGLKVKAATLPPGADPADILSSDPAVFTAALKEAKPIVEFFMAALASRERDPHKLVLLAERVVLPLIAAIPSAMEREHFVALTARALGLSSEAVRESLRRLPSAAGAESAPRSRVPAAAAPQARVSPAATRAAALMALAQAYPGTPIAEAVESGYTRITGVPLPKSAAEADIFQSEAAYGESPAESVAEDLIRAFEEAYVREAYQERVMELRRVEHSGDTAAIQAAAAAVAELGAKLAQLSR